MSGTRQYRGWIIEPYEGTHVGYMLPGSRSISQKIGSHTHRKIRGYLVSWPEEDRPPKFVDTIREAKIYIDNYMGTEENPTATQAVNKPSDTELVVGGIAAVSLVALGIYVIYQALNQTPDTTSTLEDTSSLAALGVLV